MEKTKLTIEHNGIIMTGEISDQPVTATDLLNLFKGLFIGVTFTNETWKDIIAEEYENL